MFKNLTNLASMLRQAQQVGSQMKDVQDRLKSQRATGSSGAGLVEVEVNGLGEVLRLRLDPTLIEKADREMIEDLVPAATNQALAKAKQLHLEAMKSLTAGFSLPGLDDALAQLAGGATFPSSEDEER